MNPSKVQARKMVLVSAFLLAAIAVYRDHRAGTSDTFHALWGVGVVSMLLSVLADFAPTIAGPFAVLTVLGSLASGDISIIDRVFGGSTSATRAGSTSRSSSTSAGRLDRPGGGGDFSVSVPNRAGPQPQAQPTTSKGVQPR